MIGDVSFQQPLGLRPPIPHGVLARQAEGVEAVNVASRGCDVGSPDHITARHGGNVPRIQGRSDRIELVIVADRIVQRTKRTQVLRLIVGCGLSRGNRVQFVVTRPITIFQFRDRAHQVEPFSLGCPFADHVQAVRDQRLLALSHCIRERERTCVRAPFTD